MQPTFRQTPPNHCRSTITVRFPNCAARMAQTYPAGPAPMTATSYSGMKISFTGAPASAGPASAPCLQAVDNGRQEPVGHGSIDDAVVERQRKVDHGSDGDGIGHLA